MKQKAIWKTERNESDPAYRSETQEREKMSLTVNLPFRDKLFAANKTLTDAEREKLETTIFQGELLQFAVVGDLSLKNRYTRSVLAVTDTRIYGFDENYDDSVKTFTLEEVKKASVKRYYGNALLVFAGGEGEEKTIILRFAQE